MPDVVRGINTYVIRPTADFVKGAAKKAVDLASNPKNLLTVKVKDLGVCDKIAKTVLAANELARWSVQKAEVKNDAADNVLKGVADLGGMLRAALGLLNILRGMFATMVLGALKSYRIAVYIIKPSDNGQFIYMEELNYGLAAKLGLASPLKKDKLAELEKFDKYFHRVHNRKQAAAAFIMTAGESASATGYCVSFIVNPLMVFKKSLKLDPGGHFTRAGKVFPYSMLAFHFFGAVKSVGKIAFYLIAYKDAAAMNNVVARNDDEEEEDTGDVANPCAQCGQTPPTPIQPLRVAAGTTYGEKKPADVVAGNWFSYDDYRTGLLEGQLELVASGLETGTDILGILDSADVIDAPVYVVAPMKIAAGLISLYKSFYVTG